MPACCLLLCPAHALPYTLAASPRRRLQPRRASPGAARQLHLAPTVTKRRSGRLAGLPPDVACGPDTPRHKRQRLVVHLSCSQQSLSSGTVLPAPHPLVLPPPTLCAPTPLTEAALLASSIQRSSSMRGLVIALLRAPSTPQR